MKIKFLGHAAFLITSDTGVRIITDPYKPGCFDGGIAYEAINEEADIVTISHDHDDHNDTNIKGDPVFVRCAEARAIRDVTIRGLDCYHDTNAGKDRGRNVIFKLSVDGMDVVHCGDLGHELSEEEINVLGNVDVLLVPVGGHFTIDTAGADKLVDALKPKVVIPMHFKTGKCGFPIAPIEEYIESKKVERITGEYNVTKDTLPAHTKIVVLEPTK
ncbi:MBL fold metallo-hydrolase [candidate division WOR-3 bacterium]|nr:MBL fold metallo-hydrolase [candidate division WOR-3 bacterium]